MAYDLDKNFDYHAPTESQKVVYSMVRLAFKAFADVILEFPDSRERSLALTKLEESLMWTNAAIARNNYGS